MKKRPLNKISTINASFVVFIDSTLIGMEDFPTTSKMNTIYGIISFICLELRNKLINLIMMVLKVTFISK